MPKMKSNRGAAKRFRATGSGRIKRKHAFHSHILTKKDRKRKRRLRSPTLVSRSDHHRVRRMLGGGRPMKQETRAKEREGDPPSQSSTVNNDQHERIMDLLKGQG